MEEPGTSTGALLALQVQEQAPPPTVAGPQSVFQQRPFGSPTALLASHPQGIPVSSHVTPHVPPVQPRLFIPQVQPPQPGPSTQIQSAAVFNQNQASNQIKSKPLLLEEQPLLLQDLLDQERQEQQQQKQMQALIRQRSTPDPVFPNMDLDSITDPIMKAKMVALKGINKVMTQGNLALNPLVINRFQQTPGAPVPEGTSQPPLLAGQETKVNAQLVRPDPPSFSPGFVNDSQQRQYEEWLGETQQLLQMQQRLLEDQIAAHRKTKKALSAKQRTAKKAGRVFAEEDAAQLRCVTEQQGAVQKQLEQIRKQQKDHAELIEDYRAKQQQRALQQPPAAVPPIPQTMVPLQPHTPNVQSGWAPGVMLQRVPPHTPAMVASFTAGPRGSSGPSGDSAASTPQVKFDDNNPFSEGFQERERRERLREQQERQRVQLMQEVERHRALQQRLGLEQQGHLGPPMGPGAGSRVGPAPGPGGPTALTPAGDSLSQMPFFTSELPQEFLRSAPPPRPLSQHQMEAHQGFTAGPSVPGGPQAPSGVSGAAADQARVLLEHSSPVDLARLRLSGPASVQGPVHLALAAPSHSGDQSSPSRVLHLSFDDKPKMRSRRKDGDDGGGAQTPLSSHSDDATAPATPQASSDTSCSTPTQANTDRSDSQELLTRISASLRAPMTAAAQEVKVEREEGAACREGAMKMEDGEGLLLPSPLHGGDGGKELLRHLLRDKTSDFRSEGEEEDGSAYHNNSADNLDPDPSIRKKTQRCNKRLAGRPDKDRALPKHKRRKREEEEDANSTSDQLVTQLRQLAALPLMEPVLGVDLSLFPPYGSSSLGRDSRLSGSFGNASLDGVTDYYSQLICQNNLSNPPTPPASLPPTPPPVSRQKLVNGFATTEELARKELGEQDGVSGMKQKREEPLTLNHTSKTVDVPASLPTPPHNNQEELRVQDVSEHDSPDGFIPSSSPESLADGEVSRYPDLSFIKLEPLSPCSSPTIPTAPCAWGKGSAVKLEAKVEPNPQGLSSCSSTDLVTIAMTLNAVVAQNIAGVMTAVAELLRVPVPADYQLTQLAAPESNPLTLLARVRTPLVQGSSGGQQRPVGIRMDYSHHGSLVPAKYCSSCKGLLGNGVHIVKVLKQEDQSRPGSSLVFCSTNCSALYAAAKNKATGLVLQSGSEQPLPSKTQHHYANNISSIAVHSLPQTLPSISTATTSSSSSPPSFPPASAITMETRPQTDSLKVKVKLKPLPRAVSGEENSSWHGKKMKSSRWRRWSVSITLSRGPCAPNAAVAMPTEEELDVLLEKLGACLRPDPLPKDQRRCCFCHQQGDGQTDGPARLLNLDLDLWVHLNCALWSSEVYETQAGALINVELALRRGLTLRCAHCQQTGATSGCNRLRCTNTYHFTCALQAHCTFFKDKTMLCHLHKPRTAYLVGDRSTGSSPPSTPGPTPDPMASSDPYDSELRCFAVFRRVYVQRDEARQIAAVVQRGERQHTFRVGSLLFRAVGRLLPHQMSTFHNKTAIFPVGYHANRIYWSMRQSNRRCKYMCYIEDNDSQPVFKVKVVEKGHDDLVLTGTTPKAVWDQILEPVAQLRSSTGTLKLFPGYLKGEDLFGLTTSAVTRIIESLPGVEACERYIFRYGRNPLMEWPLAFNPSGSARSEPKACQAKRTHLLTSIASRCQGSVGSIVGLVPGVISLSPGESVAGAHQGRHSKSSQYRRMKAEWKSNVYLARSRIQGLGLYAARDIEKCTMVIEYIGTIIRSEVANRKERLYESQNRGVYMFRIDNDYVIDATITGGPARYINHSCAPNCITEVVTVEKENKIVISSCRRIQRGEELCYDYKFDLEDDQHKLPCHCGAVNCRKWMN